MMIETDVILFCLFGGIVSADTDAAWQVMISQPLVACTIGGALLGNMLLGMTVGMLLQLPYLIEVPAGGAKVSLSNLGAYVGAGLAIELSLLFPNKANLILFIAVIFGILLSWVNTPLLRWSRLLNLRLLRKAEIAAESGSLGRITFYQYLGVVNAYFFGLLFTVIFLFLGEYVLRSVVLVVPNEMDSVLKIFKPVLYGAGIGTMVWIFVKRKNIKFAMLGVILGLAILLIKGLG